MDVFASERLGSGVMFPSAALGQTHWHPELEDQLNSDAQRGSY